MSGSEEQEPVESTVDLVTVRGLAAPLLLARVIRGDRVYGVRGQLVAAGFATERQLRDRAEQDQEGSAEGSPAEILFLKALPEGPARVPPRTARVTLVEMSWLAEAFEEAPGLALTAARFFFAGVTPIPATLPAADEGEDSVDDMEFDSSTVPETGERGWRHLFCAAQPSNHDLAFSGVQALAVMLWRRRSSRQGPSVSTFDCWRSG